MKILIGIAAAVVLFAGLKFLYQYFIKDQIMDGGPGMENPDDIIILDGDRTYSDPEALYDVIAGNWYSDDGRWRMGIFGELPDVCMTLEMDGSCVLETEVDYVYLMPNPNSCTELTLDARECSHDGEPAFAEVDSLYHEAGEGCGTLHLAVRLEDETEETITLVKQ